MVKNTTELSHTSVERSFSDRFDPISGLTVTCKTVSAGALSPIYVCMIARLTKSSAFVYSISFNCYRHREVGIFESLFQSSAAHYRTQVKIRRAHPPLLALLPLRSLSCIALSA